MLSAVQHCNKYVSKALVFYIENVTGNLYDHVAVGVEKETQMFILERTSCQAVIIVMLDISQMCAPCGQKDHLATMITSATTTAKTRKCRV